MKKLFATLVAGALTLASCAHLSSDRNKKQLNDEFESVVMVVVSTSVMEKGKEVELGWSGTGFSLSSGAKGSKVLTNKHVCAATTHAEYALVLPNGKQVPAKFVKISKDADLCLLDTEEKIKPVKLAKYDADRATHITVIGAPHAQFPFFTEGYVSGYHYVAMSLSDEDDMEVRFRAQFTSCPIYPGNSGSPAYNDDGYVVGIMFAGRRDAEHMTLMVPVELIHQFLEAKDSTWTISKK